MELVPPIIEKEVIDYDFILTTGVKIPLTLEPELGDSVLEEPDRFVVTLVAKPSKIDPEETLPAETAYVYKRNIATLVVRTRKQRVMTPEEQHDFKQSIFKLSRTVQ